MHGQLTAPDRDSTMQLPQTYVMHSDVVETRHRDDLDLVRCPDSHCVAARREQRHGDVRRLRRRSDGERNRPGFLRGDECRKPGSG
jgi:hypothetical protein